MKTASPELELELDVIRPEYSAQFRCIGPACEDTCCAGWSVFIDEATCGKYAVLPQGPLKVLIESNLDRLPPNADGSMPAQFARLRMNEEKRCPMLSGERLCRIHAELGEEYLSNTCARYPRIVHKIDGLEEQALALSCPEAARVVLLTPNLLAPESLATGAGQRYRFRWTSAETVSPEGDERQPGPVPMLPYFWPIREFVLRLLTNRDYALWQRLFLLGAFTRRMNALARGELDRGFRTVLREFSAAVDSGMLRASMEAIPADLNLQLDLVLQLAGLRLPRSHIGQRFLDTVAAFTKGIGNGPAATMPSLIAGYAEAYDHRFEPYFRQHPHILENFLINTVFRTLFPFGRKAGEANATPDMEREFALLASQYALMKGLLIGVAGFYDEAFGTDHVVRTVQSASKHFEHHPQFLDEAHALLVSSKLDNARGLTMLVRN